jgi:hypothetical protein
LNVYSDLVSLSGNNYARAIGRVDHRLIPRVRKVGLLRGDDIYYSPKKVFGASEASAKAKWVTRTGLFTIHVDAKGLPDP